ncbi:MAG: cadherin repeat domain-containing protein, partial [Opitutae bacterium]
MSAVDTGGKILVVAEANESGMASDWSDSGISASYIQNPNLVTIDPVSGEVRFNESPDYESQSIYHFTVTASDDGYGELSDSVDVTVNVNDINDSPLFATDTVSASVDENVSTSTVIFDANAADAD